MRSTISRSIAAVGLGAALTLMPVGVAMADGHVAPEPDVELPGDPELNNPDTFEAWLLEEFDIVATCEKDESPSTPWEVPAQPSDDEEWSFVVIKTADEQAGVEFPNEGWFYPVPGWELEHSSGKDLSHVIYCKSDVPDETETTPPTTTTSTGPVVETDRPASGDMSQVGLFAGAAAALAAAGALVLGRRRNSAQH